jgi:hypothetical protein
MVVVIHQAVSMAKPVKSLGHLGKDSKKKLPITMIPKDRFLLVPPGGDVIERAVVFDP